MVSPVSGRVIGSSEVRVVRSKEKISGLRVRSVTGVNLALEQETNPTLYTVHTHVQESLMAKYQVTVLFIHTWLGYPALAGILCKERRPVILI